MGKTQERYVFVAALAACISLVACTDPSMFGSMGPNYQPISSDLATLAAPAEPASGTQPPAAYCRVSAGTALFGTTWKDFKTADFSLPPATRIQVTLTPMRGSDNMEFQAFFDAEGQKMMFCPYIEGPPDERIACASLYVLEDDLTAGIKRTFDIPKAVQGGVISCAKDYGKIKQ
jgi:hypothetical protein